MCHPPQRPERRTEQRRAELHDRPERPQPWRNTRPRGNPETDVRDLERSVERLETLLGR